MKYLTTILALTLIALITACSDKTQEEKGFQVTANSGKSDKPEAGISRDSLKINTRPSNVLLTGVPNVRLATVYKLNMDRDGNSTFIGSNYFHYNYEDGSSNNGNNWNSNLMPGLEAVYGFNMVNISHYDIKENRQKNFFSHPVLVKTLYYPSFSKDTLNNEPVNRNYFMVSVYNDDTNKDGFINLKDLRRFYFFNINGDSQTALVPENYSVFKSEYDPGNDFMYVFARLDSNNNGEQDEAESTHIFWIDLKDPLKTGRVY